MQFLRRNTAVIVAVGPFLDKTDGVTLKTALTITNEKITLTADTDDGSAPTNILDNVTGATSGTSNDLNYITGNDAGMMQLELSASNTDRLGRMTLVITDAANHVPVFHSFCVLPAAIYDFFVGTAGFTAAMFALDTGLRPIRTNTAQAGGASTITLDASASATDDFYNYLLVQITTNTGAGQIRVITDYVGSTKVATISGAWATNPDNTSVFNLLSSAVIASSTPPTVNEIADQVWDEGRSGHVVAGSFGEGVNVATDGISPTAIAAGAIHRASFAADTGLQTGRSNTAQSATASTITLDSGASAVNDFYQYQLIYLTGGTGSGQARMITGYVGSTKVATISPDWATTPDNTSTFAILPSGVLSVAADGIKRNTAFNDFEFVMYDSADHLTAKTGLTVSAQRSIDSGAFAPCTNSPSEVSNGVYVIDFAAADLNGTTITFRFTATGADPTFMTVVTVP